jgi:uncharacterized protein YdaU (DUF1376 family)
MSLHIGDYLRDTGILTVTEHGAYLLRLTQAWTTAGNCPPTISHDRPDGHAPM